MGRIGRGWSLTKKSWSVVRSDPALIGFTMLSVLAGIVCAALFLGTGVGLVVMTDADWVAVPVLVLGAYVLTVVGTFAGVALTCGAVDALDGRPANLRDCLREATSRLPLVLRWAGVRFGVGVLISILEALLKDGAGQVTSQIVGGLAGFAWRVATFFVIPAIAIERLAPKAAFKRSTSLIRSQWGEGLTGTIAIGAIFGLLGVLPGFVLIGLGVVAAKSFLALGVVLMIVGGVLAAVAMLLQSTVMAVFKVALYRYAMDGTVVAPFTAEELQHAFLSRRRTGALAGRHS
ncbi:hypothetical protein GIS00_16150 [Nakamurella sp. YIM 132087]|uniref:Glycerophosphoryl diester phosphodiesterase membrane domain-containing protein n=1 Tax=Nakamurella alba TaxID=2665158 RepID=A0A7K1FMX1_9ACTN|nr:DUF6159 family protein [Nakamurella alba]MTD15468.1 hypothetical protein [Nakamurella alba]